MNGPIGVLCGGPSAEREISLRSGRAIHEALLLEGLPSLRLELSEDRRQIPGQIQQAGIGVAFIALHGAFGEDGTIQALLEQMQIPYTGSWVEACRYAMDKSSARKRWLATGLPVPRGMVAEPINAVARVEKGQMPYPLVVKPSAQGSSIGISIVDRPEDLPSAVEEAGRYGEQILIEAYLSGPELTVGILEDRPLPIIQVVPRRRFYDFEAKYTPGMTEYRVPAPLPDPVRRRVQTLALAAHEAIGCRSFSRVDLILTPDRGPVLLEINVMPGMTATSLLPKAAAAVGIGFPELCRRMLGSAFGPVRPERRSSFDKAPRPARWARRRGGQDERSRRVNVQ